MALSFSRNYLGDAAWDSAQGSVGDDMSGGCHPIPWAIDRNGTPCKERNPSWIRPWNNSQPPLDRPQQAMLCEDGKPRKAGGLLGVARADLSYCASPEKGTLGRKSVSLGRETGVYTHTNPQRIKRLICICICKCMCLSEA